MSIESWSANTRAGDEDVRRMGSDFIRFVKTGGYTADQTRAAYYRLVGISEAKDDTPATVLILRKMREMADLGFPLDYFVAVIDTQVDVENAVPSLYTYLHSLKVSDSEKRVLKSVFDQDRKGEVICTVDGKDFAEFKIERRDESKEQAADAFTRTLKEIVRKIPEGKRYEFSFSESQ